MGFNFESFAAPRECMVKRFKPTLSPKEKSSDNPRVFLVALHDIAQTRIKL